MASGSNTVFNPAAHGLYDLNLRWVVVAILVASAVLPLLWVFRWRRQYEQNIAAEAMPQRWIEMAVTSVLMMEVVAIVSGVHDVMTLKLVSGFMLLTCALGWLADKQNRKTNQTDWTAYVMALVSGAFPWLLIAVTALATYFYGMVRSPWWVYALYVVTLGGFGLMAFTQHQHYRKANQWKYETVERRYILISILTKVAFAAVLLAGLHK